MMRNINNCLRRNRKILRDLCQEQMEQVDRHQLIQKGFRFGYCTHIKERHQTALHYCYDIGYYEKRGKVHLVSESQ